MRASLMDGHERKFKKWTISVAIISGDASGHHSVCMANGIYGLLVNNNETWFG